MLLKATVFASFIGSILAKDAVYPSGGIRASSTAGKKLLSKARALDGQQQEQDFAWMTNYDIKYTGCSRLVQIRDEGDGGEEALLYTQNLAKFSLCPSDSTCSSCSGGGEYVVNMLDFLDVYTETKMNEQEQLCENIRENCYCNNDDEDACEYACYQNAGAEECINYEGDEEFEIQRYLECAEMEGQEENNNNNNAYYYNENGNNNVDNWYVQYFIGPYCSEKDGFSIHLGVFYDQACSSRGNATAYANKHYGTALPFSEESIVQSDCISCTQVNENNNNNNNNNNYNYNNNGNNNYAEPNELCTEMYEQSAKCEYKMDLYYKDTYGCQYIKYLLPQLENATGQASSEVWNEVSYQIARTVQTDETEAESTSGGSSGGSITTSWIFGDSGSLATACIFGVTTVLFGAYACFLYWKLSRTRVNLAGSDGDLA